LKKPEKLLSQGAVHHGYPNELRTLKRMAAPIEKQFGVAASSKAFEQARRCCDR